MDRKKLRRTSEFRSIGNRLPTKQKTEEWGQIQGWSRPEVSVDGASAVYIGWLGSLNIRAHFG
jgi:hypothetical protein